MKPTQYDPTDWHAIAYDGDGYSIEHDDLLEWMSGDVGEPPAELVIVTGSAVPRSQSDAVDDFHRAPGSHRELDRIMLEDVESWEPDAIGLRWEQFRRIAELWNADRKSSDSGSGS